MNPKSKGSFLMLIIALVVIGLGYIVLSTITGQIDGTSSANNICVSNVDTAFSIFPPLIIVISIVIVLGLISYYISSPTRYIKTNAFLERIVDFLDTTTYYFAFGLMFFAIIGVVALAGYVLLNVISFAGESGVGIEIGKWIVICIVAYFGIAGVGYLFKRFMWDKYKRTKELALYKQNMEELPKGG